MGKKNYLKQLLIAIDQLLNALFNGWADETLSSRCYRNAMINHPSSRTWRLFYYGINYLFFDKSHCKTAYYSEQSRNQLPPEMRR